MGQAVKGIDQVIYTAALEKGNQSPQSAHRRKVNNRQVNSQINRIFAKNKQCWRGGNTEPIGELIR